MSSTDNRPTRIGIKQLCKRVPQFAVLTALAVVYTFTYNSLSSELRSEPISKWLIAHIVFTWAIVWLSGRYLLLIIQNYGRLMTAQEWKTIENKKDFITYWAEFANLGEFITSIYFLARWNQADDHTYDGTPQAEMTVKIIAIFFIVRLCLILLPLVLAIFFCCCPCFAECFTERHQTRAANANASPSTNITNSARRDPRYDVVNGSDRSRSAPLVRPDPIPSAPPVSGSDQSQSTGFWSNIRSHNAYKSSKNVLVDGLSIVMPTPSAPVSETCSVCTDEFSETDQWKALPCTHVFHPHCIDPWVQLHNTCPNCRAQVVIPGDQNV